MRKTKDRKTPKERLAAFLKVAYKNVKGDESTTYHMMIMPKYNLSVGVAWDKENGVRAKICVFDDLIDYEWAEQPYNPETGDVWDTEGEIVDHENWDWLAGWYLDQVNEMIPEIETGHLTATYMNK